MSDLQSLLDQAPAGQALKLTPAGKEMPGPVILRKAIVLDGQGATIFAERGPVLTIASAGVLLENLNVEVTASAPGEGDAGCALAVEGGGAVTLRNVAVVGTVRGLS